MSHNELEALVSHLYVLGGRAVSAPPPGALVQLAPRSAPRSRLPDAFFVLVLPAAQGYAKAVFYEEMARLAAQRYFEHDGPVTAALDHVLSSINADLFAHNDTHPDQPFYAELACLVLRQQMVTVARTNGAMISLWQDGTYRTFPDDLAALAEAKPEAPLGTTAAPQVETHEYAVAAGHMAALSDIKLATTPSDALRAAGLRGSVQQTVGRLKAHGPQEATALLMQFIPPDVPDPEPVAATATTGIPVAGAAEEAEETPAEESPAAETSAEKVSAEESAAAETPAEEAPAAAASSRFVRSQDADAEAGSGGVGQRLRGLVSRGRERQQSLKDAASAAAPAINELQTEGRNIFYRVAQRFLLILRRLLLYIVAGLNKISALLGRLLPEPEPGKPPSLPTPVAMAAVVVIPVAVVLLVIAVALTTQDETAFERCLATAQTALSVAQDIRDNNSGDAQEAWYGVMEVVNRCMPRRPDDPLLLTIREEAQREIDGFAEVVRCPVTPLRRYEAGADLRGPILRNGIDLYTLDVTRSALYRDTLNEAGNALSRDSDLLTQRGAAVGEFTIRNLVDVAWVDDGGIPRSNGLIALDARGVLVAYSPTFPPATAQALQGADRWIRPVAIDTWQGRLYILDPPANQIWRYQPVAGEYPSLPEEYFVLDERPDLSNAVDFAIDESGYIFVLMNDGSMLRFLSGESQFFQFSQLPGGGVGSLGSASSLYLDLGLRSIGFYVIDGANQQIHETTAGGTFIRTYRAPDSSSFRDVSGVASDSDAENLYVTAREALYHVPRCD